MYVRGAWTQSLGRPRYSAQGLPRFPSATRDRHVTVRSCPMLLLAQRSASLWRYVHGLRRSEARDPGRQTQHAGVQISELSRNEAPPGVSMTMNVTINREPVPIDRDVFAALVEQSVVCDRAVVRDALRDGTISFRKLVALSREAEIPYPLFFAAPAVAHEQLRIKREKLMKGFNTKSEFAMNSRNRVHLPQVELPSCKGPATQTGLPQERQEPAAERGRGSSSQTRCVGSG